MGIVTKCGRAGLTKAPAFWLEIKRGTFREQVPVDCKERDQVSDLIKSLENPKVAPQSVHVILISISRNFKLNIQTSHCPHRRQSPRRSTRVADLMRIAKALKTELTLEIQHTKSR